MLISFHHIGHIGCWPASESGGIHRHLINPMAAMEWLCPLEVSPVAMRARQKRRQDQLMSAAIFNVSSMRSSTNSSERPSPAGGNLRTAEKKPDGTWLYTPRPDVRCQRFAHPHDGGKTLTASNLAVEHDTRRTIQTPQRQPRPWRRGRGGHHERGQGVQQQPVCGRYVWTWPFVHPAPFPAPTV